MLRGIYIVGDKSLHDVVFFFLNLFFSFFEIVRHGAKSYAALKFYF